MIEHVVGLLVLFGFPLAFMVVVARWPQEERSRPSRPRPEEDTPGIVRVSRDDWCHQVAKWEREEQRHANRQAERHWSNIL